MEKEITFQSNNILLSGTLATPDSGNTFPAVLLVPGSGPIDRNENHKKAHLNVFKDLSGILAANGIASLRYDKRGVGSSGGDYWETGYYDNCADASAALDYLKTRQEVNPDKIFLLGHSEGAYISIYITARREDISGAILLAGSASSGEETLKWQALKVVEGMKGLNKWLIKLFRIDVAKAQQKQLDKIKRTDKSYYRTQLVVKINAKWLREFMSYHPALDMVKIQTPVLAITGSKDIQVNPEDLKLMANLIKSPFEYNLLPDVSH
jgi:pimeloyl-ACP methyl ester carboxylesterase